MEERFAGACVDICSNTNLSPDIQAVCDAGSQEYCTSGNNIFTPNCKAYLTRVAATATANKTNSVYKSAIQFMPVVAGKPTANAQTYYNALNENIHNNAQNITDYSNQDISDIVNIIKTNDPSYASNNTYQNLAQRAINHCMLTKAVNIEFCSETSANPSWAAQEFKNHINKFITEIQNRKFIGSLLAAYSSYIRQIPDSPFKITEVAKHLTDLQLAHKRMPNTLKPVDDMVLASLTSADLLDPNLVLLRAISPYMQASVDAFVLNYINNSKSTYINRERLATDPSNYNITINNGDTLYGVGFRTFLTNLMAYNKDNNITTDPLVSLVQQTDNTNIATCSAAGTNPLTNPLCQSISKAIGPSISTTDNATNILNSTILYCSNANNVSSPSCVAHINGNQKLYNMQDVNTKMLNYCLSTTGAADANNCSTFSPITGSSEWLAAKTANTTNATTNITSTVCGTADGLTTDQCKSVCKQYPSLCQTDIQAKCSLPNYRYSNDVSFFDNKEKFYGIIGGENGDASKELFAFNIFLWILIAIVVSLLGVAGIAYILNKLTNSTNNILGESS